MERHGRFSKVACVLVVMLAAGVASCGSTVPVRLGSASAAATLNSPAASHTTAATPSPATAATASRFTASGIAFDYPSGWDATQLDVQRHYETVLGLLGNGGFAEACPSDAQPGEFNTCTEQLALAPSTVVVKVSLWHLPTPAGMSQVGYQQYADPSAVPMMVAHQRAVLERLGEPLAGGDQHWLWLIDAPGSSGTAYAFEAWLRGPNLEALRAQLDTLVAGASVEAPSP